MIKIHEYSWMNDDALEDTVAEVNPGEELALSQLKTVAVELTLSYEELAAMDQPITDQDIRDLLFEEARELLWVQTPKLLIEVESTNYESFTVEEAWK